ncbi:MAG: hypothetical protein K0Q55_3119 [Verrucomicrobia bacterium]|jgi:hypothetical protein|nr:hypothetical protein [Verrucomicrobiota bacterium]
MEYQRQSHGWLTFLEHNLLVTIVISALIVSRLLDFFSQLAGLPWIWCYAAALVTGGIGIVKILYSKLPLYRQHRFFTFGGDALPEDRKTFYRWGWRCVLFSIALMLGLSLSHP